MTIHPSICCTMPSMLESWRARRAINSRRGVRRALLVCHRQVNPAKAGCWWKPKCCRGARHLRRIAVACRWRRRCREPVGERMHGRRPQRCRRPSPDGRCKAACIGHEATIRQVSVRRHGSTACRDEQQTLTLQVICCGSEFESMQEVRCSKGSLHDATSRIEGQTRWQQRCRNLSAPQVPAMTMPTQARSSKTSLHTRKLL